MRYPAIPPNVEAIVEIIAYLNEFFGFKKDKAICNMSGGTGKKEDSVKELRNKNQLPIGLCAKDRVFSFNLSNKKLYLYFLIFSELKFKVYYSFSELEFKVYYSVTLH
jgi:hypothetical protein